MNRIDATPLDISCFRSDAGGAASAKSNVLEILTRLRYQWQSGLLTAPITRALRRGQHVYRPGDAPKCVYFVQHGTLRTYLPSEGQYEQTTGFHSAGKLLGLDALVNRPMRGGANALDATLVQQISVHMIEACVGDSAPLRLQLMEAMYDEIASSEAHVLVHRYGASRRLAHFIVRAAGESAMLNLPMSHKEIGNYLSLAPETLSRALARFQHCGWLSAKGHSIEILDRAALEQIASGRIPRSRPKAVPDK
ncbi:MAG: helix-turn-helix domain-containing protein [Rudaea sp.]